MCQIHSDKKVLDLTFVKEHRHKILVFIDKRCCQERQVGLVEVAGLPYDER